MPNAIWTQQTGKSINQLLKFNTVFFFTCASSLRFTYISTKTHAYCIRFYLSSSVRLLHLKPTKLCAGGIGHLSKFTFMALQYLLWSYAYFDYGLVFFSFFFFFFYSQQIFRSFIQFICTQHTEHNVNNAVSSNANHFIFFFLLSVGFRFQSCVCGVTKYVYCLR